MSGDQAFTLNCCMVEPCQRDRLKVFHRLIAIIPHDINDEGVWQSGILHAVSNGDRQLPRALEYTTPVMFIPYALRETVCSMSVTHDRDFIRTVDNTKRIQYKLWLYGQIQPIQSNALFLLNILFSCVLLTVFMLFTVFYLSLSADL